MNASESSEVLRALIARIEAALEEETKALDGIAPQDVAGFVSRKNSALFELMKFRRANGGVALPPERLAELRDRLAANQGILARHLAAAREITGLVMEALREAEEAGTYAPRRQPAGGLSR
jgi:ABC-type phosphate/phosphonate transport system substrate-binding protein